MEFPKSKIKERYYCDKENNYYFNTEIYNLIEPKPECDNRCCSECTHLKKYDLPLNPFSNEWKHKITVTDLGDSSVGIQEISEKISVPKISKNFRVYGGDIVMEIKGLKMGIHELMDLRDMFIDFLRSNDMIVELEIRKIEPIK